MNGREIYEESTYLAAQMAQGGERWPLWEDLEPQQRANWEALAAEQSRKAIDDYEAERRDRGLFERTEDDEDDR